MLFTLSVNCSKSDGFIVALVVFRNALLLLYRAAAAAVTTAGAASLPHWLRLVIAVVMLCSTSHVSRVATTILSAGVVRAVAYRSHSKPPAFELFSRLYFYEFSYTFELLSLLLLPRIPRCSPPHLRILCAILSLPPTQLLLLFALPLLLYVLAISCHTCWAFCL